MQRPRRCGSLKVSCRDEITILFTSSSAASCARFRDVGDVDDPFTRHWGTRRRFSTFSFLQVAPSNGAPSRARKTKRTALRPPRSVETSHRAKVPPVLDEVASEVGVEDIRVLEVEEAVPEVV